jgi:hypothetical protein
MAIEKNVTIENDFLMDSEKSKKERETDIKFKNIKHKIPESVVFKKYKPISEIAAKIAKELTGEKAFKKGSNDNTGYQSIRENGYTFFMSTDIKETGLLSLLPAVYSAIILYDKMKEGNSNNKDEA